MKIISIIILVFSLFIPGKDYCSFRAENKFKSGNEVLLEKDSILLSGKRLGIITNKSGVLSSGELLLDVLNEKYILAKIFTPEHGLRGDDNIENFTDEKTGVKVVSLYGKKFKPSADDLSNLDILIYDIQDVGARFYTFINTLYYCMESAYENQKEFIVCDRPLIPDANYVDGFLLDESQKSFVGLINIPIAYGMTCGELAGYINSEYFEGKCNLKISLMENYFRSTDYESLNLPWIKPSPNIYFPSSAITYLGTCLFEGTNISEGRGSVKPFEYIGAPYCNGDLLVSEMEKYNLKGVRFESISFIPEDIPGIVNSPKYTGEKCNGVYINVTDRSIFEPVRTAIALMVSIHNLFPGFKFNKNNFIDKLSGNSSLREMVTNGSSFENITESYINYLNDFKTKRNKYLLYH